SFATLPISLANVKSSVIPAPGSAKNLRVPAQLGTGAPDVHDEHPLGVVRVAAAQAVKQQPVLEVSDVQAGPVRREPGELPAVVLGGVPHPADDLRCLPRRG